MPPVLDETTPMRPTSRKGALRAEIENRLQEASDRGVRTIILRAGDFFGGGRGSWLDLVVAKQIGRGLVTYPGPLDLMHEWAYLPDLVAAMVRLVEVRDKLGAFEAFGFPGHAVTGREFVAALAKAARRGLQVKRMSWWLIHVLRPVVPICRELSEMAYLWQVPHRISGAKLAAAIGPVPHTRLNDAIAQALRDLGAVA
jgi:nucleoside-diphosphate-sugar epimerase